MSTLQGIHHLSLSVRDLERSAAWYADVLGLERIAALPDEGSGAKVLLRHPDSPVVLVLTRHRANPGEPFSERRTGLDHLAFWVPSEAELAAWRVRLAERGVEHQPIAPQRLGTGLVFRDPDNIQLELYVPSPAPGGTSAR
jgi:glyoxylase I family protein